WEMCSALPILSAINRSSLRARPLALPSRHNTIFFVTLPKSGTEFFWGGILDATALVKPDFLADRNLMKEVFSGYGSWPDATVAGVLNAERLLADGLRPFASGGYVFGSHGAATYHNIRALQDAGYRRVTVLMRDPRDNTVSWTHHLRALGPAGRNYHS